MVLPFRKGWRPTALTVLLLSLGVCPVEVSELALTVSDGTVVTVNSNETREAAIHQSFGFKRSRFGASVEMHDVSGATIGVPQVIPAKISLDTRRRIVNRIFDAQDYFNVDIKGDPFYRAVWDVCKNLNENCARWAELGECGKNVNYMDQNCAPVCYTCGEMHTETRCPLDLNQKNVWYPGDLNRMFERIVDEYDQYNVTVHSRPSFSNGDTSETADYMLGPWVISIDDFISEEEATTLIRLGADEGYSLSTDVGELQDDGSFGVKESSGRTSTNAWCDDDCVKHNVTQAVTKRIVDLTNIPKENAELYQMLRYEPGQFYNIHHDYIEKEEYRMQGPRILTVFMYLNNVEEGGATNFSELDLAVRPKRGRVLIWPSVLDEDPHKKDPRTDHEAQKVIKGIKYGANAWYHMRNYRIPEEKRENNLIEYYVTEHTSQVWERNNDFTKEDSHGVVTKTRFQYIPYAELS